MQYASSSSIETIHSKIAEVCAEESQVIFALGQLSDSLTLLQVGVAAHRHARLPCHVICSDDPRKAPAAASRASTRFAATALPWRCSSQAGLAMRSGSRRTPTWPSSGQSFQVGSRRSSARSSSSSSLCCFSCWWWWVRASKQASKQASILSPVIGVAASQWEEDHSNFTDPLLTAGGSQEFAALLEGYDPTPVQSTPQGARLSRLVFRFVSFRFCLR